MKKQLEFLNEEIPKLEKEKFNNNSQREKSVYLVIRGDLWSVLKEKEKSLRDYSDSVRILNKLIDDNHNDKLSHIDIAVSYMKIGEVLAESDNINEALKQYDKSFSILTSDINKEFIKDLYTGLLWRLSVIYRGIGEKQLRLGKLEDALSQYQKEYKLVELFAIHTSLSKELTVQAELNLARSNKRLGETEEKLGRNEIALNYYKNALKQHEKVLEIYYQSLSDAAPISRDKGEIVGGLVNIYNDLGRITMKVAGFNNKKKLLEAEEFFAKSLKSAPDLPKFFHHDMELAWLQGDAARCRQRIATLDNLLKPEDAFHNIVRFYEWLLKPESSWQPLLSAIESAGEAVRPDWNFSTSLPKIQQLPDQPRQAAEIFIAYFERKINLSELRQKLNSLQQTAQQPSGGQ